MPDPLDNYADEFDCPDCGRHIYSLPPAEPPPTLCVSCQWLREFIADPIERDELRARIGLEPPPSRRH